MCNSFSKTAAVAGRAAWLLLAVALWLPARGTEPAQEGFEQANRLYEQGKFREAADLYGAISVTNRSAALIYNRGNAWFKAGEIGRAICAYREALTISPRDPDLRANLRFARDQVQGPTLRESRFLRWLGSLTVTEWTWLATVPLWVLLLLMAAMQWRPALRASLRVYVVAAALATVAFGVCTVVALQASRSTAQAIVTADEVTVRHGPLEDSAMAFTAHDGAELRVLDTKDDWVQVTPDSRRVGWLQRSQVVLAPAR